MIIIRDLHRQPVDTGPLQATVARHSERVQFTRGRITAAEDGVALLTLTWDDGTNTLAQCRDGHAAVSWLIRQPWAQGRVQMS